MASYTYFALDLGDEHRLGCKCCRFSTGTDLPIPKKLTNEEIAPLARKFSHQVFADWTQLNAILKRYEGVVQKRWMKKNGKQRRGILLKAWPDMAATHRPDFVGFRKGFKNLPRSRTMLSKSYLWPYINLEDLLQRHMLLLFINSRGRNLPDKFISTDIEAAHLGKGWEFYPDQKREAPFIHVDADTFKDGICMMLLHGEHSPRSYGQLVVRNGLAPLTKSAMSHHPGLGLLGLEIQQEIYAFLLRSVKLILHDVKPDQFFLKPHEPAPPVPQQQADGYSSFSAHALEAPYRAPQLPDLDRIKSLVGARRAAAEDHLWLIRDDPGYFLDSLRDWKEHDWMTVKHSCSRCYNVVASRMISDAFTYFFFWDHISRLLEKLPPVEDQLKRADPFLLRLAPAEEIVWAETLEVVNYLLYEPIAALRTGVPPSPRLRHCFEEPKDLRAGDTATYDWTTKRKISDAERRVTGLMFALVDNEQRHLHSLNHIIQEILYTMEADPTSSELIDPWINSQIADLALLSELKLRIEGLQPWHTAWKSHKVQSTNPVKKRVDTLIRVASSDVRECMTYVGIEIGFELLTDPLDGRLDYPITKAHTKANVDQLRRAEKGLEKFWTDVEGDLKALTGTTIISLMKLRMTPRKKHRTPPWKEPSKPATLNDNPVLRELHVNVPSSRVGTSAKVEIASQTPKTKIKTRGFPSSPATPDADAEPATPCAVADDAPAQLEIQPVEVSKRAFRALDALLPAATSTSHQRLEIAWNELLAAMDEIGLQPEKLYGSVWVFKPREDGRAKVDVGRSISFHEPKEVRKGHKIPASMVRTFGRRLKHAYGWVDGMFVCQGRKA